MAKVNTGQTRTGYRQDIKDVRTTNYEGGEAFELTPKSRLVQMTSTCLFNEPKFYGNLGDTEQKILDTAKEVAKEDPKFLLQLANYLRNEQYLRSISNWLLVFTANERIKGHHMREIIPQYGPKVIRRADELKEVMAMQLTDTGKPIPNSLKGAIRNAFPQFDEYQFAKYNRKNTKGAITYKDVMMLTHPKMGKLGRKILDENLKTPVTWETELTEKGNKKEVWESLIANRKLPYMASIRNLRNILNAKVDVQYIKMLCEFISNPNAVKRSKQLPFRFFTAYREIENIGSMHTSKLLDALEDAMAISYENIPKLHGSTLIACDVSGSMFHPLSRRSSLQLFDVGLILGAMAHKFTDESIVGIFGSTWKPINLSKRSGVIGNVMNMHNREGEVGYSTNGHLVIRWALENKQKVDRFMFFSDNQIWNSHARYCDDVLESRDVSTAYEELLEYRQKVNPNARMYIFDLAGYGTTSFPEQDRRVVGIGGWSDKIFKFIKNYEHNPDEQVRYIMGNY